MPATNDRHSCPPRERFVLYPDPRQAPDIRYQNERQPTPKMPPWLLGISAYLIESWRFLRQLIWVNAGFSSLRKISDHIEDTEPRFDPTVFPSPELKSVSSSKPTDDVQNGHFPEVKLLPHAGKLYSAAYYRSAYLAGQLTPADVVKAILPLIRTDTSPRGEHSLAWINIKAELAIAAAEASTARYARKQSLGPLDGVPTAVKDEYDMQGYATTLGSPNDYAHHELEGSEMDTWCVRKLQEAGAIILGKLSMHEFGMDTSGNNILFGTPRNPYNHHYYTGGSSSGPAYAVATGLLPFVMGSDGGGSIRIPSSFCSVFGLKPTHGRLSFLPGQNHSNTVGVNGPIAADVRSLAALFSVVSAPHPSSLFFPCPPPITDPELKDVPRPKVIGIMDAWFQRATPAIQTLCRSLVDRLVAEKGYTVVPIIVPFLAEGQTAHALTILTDAATLLPDTRGLSPANRILLALGRTTPATDFLLAAKLRHLLMRHLAYLWEQHPGMVIVTPTTPCAGWPIRSAAELKYGLTDGDYTVRTMEYVWLGNFCGLPSLSVPAGYVVPEGRPGAGEVAGAETAGKVPVGLLATGEWCSEEALLRFGLDAEAVGADIYCRPPSWVDVPELARQKSQMGG